MCASETIKQGNGQGGDAFCRWPGGSKVFPDKGVATVGTPGVTEDENKCWEMFLGFTSIKYSEVGTGYEA